MTTERARVMATLHAALDAIPNKYRTEAFIDEIVAARKLLKSLESTLVEPGEWRQE